MRSERSTTQSKGRSDDILHHRDSFRCPRLRESAFFQEADLPPPVRFNQMFIREFITYNGDDSHVFNGRHGGNTLGFARVHNRLELVTW